MLVIYGVVFTRKDTKETQSDVKKVENSFTFALKALE